MASIDGEALETESSAYLQWSKCQRRPAGTKGVCCDAFVSRLTSSFDVSINEISSTPLTSQNISF